MASKLTAAVFGILALGAAQPVYADTVTWADLNADNGQINSPSGQITGSIGSVGVTFAGDYAFDQLNNTGAINYWTNTGGPGGNYTPVADAPSTNSDIIGLSDAGQATITFSQAVQNVFIAFNSFNGADVTFDSPFTIVSQGCGYWGCGSFVPNAGNTEFTGDGELVGVLEFHNITSLAFNDSVPEYWHGIDIGISPPSSNPVPERLTLSLFGVGLAGAAALRRRKKKAA